MAVTRWIDIIQKTSIKPEQALHSGKGKVDISECTDWVSSLSYVFHSFQWQFFSALALAISKYQPPGKDIVLEVYKNIKMQPLKKISSSIKYVI